MVRRERLRRSQSARRDQGEFSSDILWFLFFLLVLLGAGVSSAFLVGIFWAASSLPPAHPHSALLQSGDLVGWKEEEVVARVGEPSWRDHRAWYDLGPHHGARGLTAYLEGDFEHAILMLHFDADTGRVTDFRVDRLSRFPAAMPFSPAAWQTGTAVDRCSMTWSLTQVVALRGMSKSELLALLGPPDGEKREINYEDENDDFFEPVLCIHLVLDDMGVVREQYFSDY